MRSLSLLAASFLLALGCSSGGGGGSGPGSCDAQHQACSSPDPCPELSCKCPGSKFTATIQACQSGCCATNCAEACGIQTGPCDNVSCSGHGTCSAPGGTAECKCDAGYVLATGNQCVPEGSECTSPADCVDDNPCTSDSCSGGECSHSPSSDGACDDGNACTENDACSAGLCFGTFIDGDGDGQAPKSCGGSDCNDADPTVYSNGAERTASGNCSDQKDNDCDGATDSSDFGCSAVLADFCTADKWCWEDPLPTGDTLQAVWGSGPNDVWMVGGRSVVHFDGSKLRLRDPGVNGHFTSVHGTGPSDVWVAGIDAVVHFDGTQFSDASAGLDLKTNPDLAASIWAVGPNDVWLHHGFTASHWNGSVWSAAVSVGVAASNSSPLWGSPSGKVHVAGDSTGGPGIFSWDAKSSGSAAKELLPFSIYPKSISGTSDDDLWLAGANYSGSSYSGMIAHRTAAGWTLQQPAKSDVPLVFAAGPIEAWLTTGTSFLHYDGTAFKAVQGAAPQAPKAIWGSSPNDLWAVGAAGSIQRFDGKSWSETSTRLPSSCGAVWGASDTAIYCVGAKGLLARRGAAGWAPVASGTTENLADVWGGSASDIWAVGAKGTRVRGDGTSFSAAKLAVTGGLVGISGTSATDVWAVTDKNGVQHFDGTSFKVVVAEGTATNGNGGVKVWARPGSTPSAYVVRSALISTMKWHVDSCTPTGCGSSYSTSNQLFDLWGFGSDVWAVGYGSTGFAAVVHGPGSWTSQKLAGFQLTGVWGSSATDVWVVGTGSLYRYDGTTWNPVAGVPESSVGVWTGGSDVWFVGGGIVRYTP